MACFSLLKSEVTDNQREKTTIIPVSRVGKISIHPYKLYIIIDSSIQKLTWLGVIYRLEHTSIFSHCQLQGTRYHQHIKPLGRGISIIREFISLVRGKHKGRGRKGYPWCYNALSRSLLTIILWPTLQAAKFTWMPWECLAHLGSPGTQIQSHSTWHPPSHSNTPTASFTWVGQNIILV